MDLSTKVSGDWTAGHWKAESAKLKPGKNEHLWKIAFTRYFRERLQIRYFDPIKAIEGLGKHEGKGFAIVAIQCSLIEFLESTYQGKAYKHMPVKKHCDGCTCSLPTKPVAAKVVNEYHNSSGMFTKFLRSKMSDSFTTKQAESFYKAVRCGLLHEARTKGDWKINVGDGKGPPVKITAGEKIVYWKNLRRGISEYIDWYEGELLASPDLQKKFKDKLDKLFLE